MSDDGPHTSFPFVFHKDLGEVKDQKFGSRLFPLLKILTTPKYRSMIMPQINVRFLLSDAELNESNEIHEFTTALHLASAHVASVQVEKRHEEYRQVTFVLNKPPLHAVGLFGNRDFGNQTPQLQLVRSMVSEAFQKGTLQTLVRGGEAVNKSITRVYQLLVAERSRNVFAPWYSKHPDKVYLEPGDYPPSSQRPFIPMSAKSAFAEINEYMTIVGYARIGEHEHETQAAEALGKRTIKLRCMTIPKAGNRPYFGFLQMPLRLVRVKPGDNMEVRFWDRAQEKYIGWDAQVTMPMPYSPQGAVSTLPTRPYDIEQKDLVNMTEEIQPIEIENMGSSNDIRKALEATKARPVKVKMHVSDLPLTRQLAAFRNFQDNSKSNSH